MSIRTIVAGSRARTLCGSAILGALLGIPPAAFAQSASTGSQIEGNGTESDSEIVVTGTSIRGIPPTGSGLISVSRDDAKLILATDAELASPRGQALRTLLYMFEADEAVRLFRAA